MATPEEIIKQISPYYKKKGKPAKEYVLGYDSSSETLEPVYFWILDFMNNKLGLNPEKLVDSFTSSPGSGHFSELMGKATKMQEEAMKIYGMVNAVIKSIQTLIYDLKEFQLRIKQYDDSKSTNKDIALGGLIGLKQIWMDQVDMKKGTGSINMLSRDLNFVTLRDAFMYASSAGDVEKMDVNDRVKRILKARVQEFNEWRKMSEVELKKRFEIEKTYLKTQVDTVKMYSRWAKPYLIAAEQLRMKDSKAMRYNPSVVNVFNTLYLQLTLFAKREVDIKDNAANKKLPQEFGRIRWKRKYYQCILVDFTFRGIPRNVGQHYAFGGRTDVKFSSYALNDEEYNLFKYKLEKSEFDDALNLVEGMTRDSLEQLKADIDSFLENKPIEEKKEQEVNPFMALFGLKRFKKDKKPQNEEEQEEQFNKAMAELEKKGIKKDNYAEGVVRTLAEDGATDECYAIYDVYKKAHGMASAPNEGFNLPKQ